jgi:hypothetical protein
MGNGNGNGNSNSNGIMVPFAVAIDQSINQLSIQQDEET